MRALLLAAGLGTRLRPLTDGIPKCLVPIHGKPLLQIWLERLTEAGIGPFLVNTHYHAEAVRDFVAASAFSSSVDLVHETELRGTAGTLLSNREFFGSDDGMLVHADNYCLADFREFVDAHVHRPPECLLTMMTFRASDPSSCGIVELDARGVVTGFHEKTPNPPGNLANGAVYLLSQELLAGLERDFVGATDFSIDVLGKLTGRMYSYETSATFLDIGTPATYALANRAE